MALIQDIISQLGLLGIPTTGMGYSDIGGLSPTTIQSSLAETYGVSPADMPLGIFQTLSSGMLESGRAKTYSPLIQSKSSSFLSDLTKNLTGSEATKSHGGFAGTGGSARHEKLARDVYGGSMTDVIGDASKQQTEGLSNIMDVINSWRDVALRIRGDV